MIWLRLVIILIRIDWVEAEAAGRRIEAAIPILMIAGCWPRYRVPCITRLLMLCDLHEHDHGH